MKTTVSFNEFCDAWKNHDRNGSFSYEGKRALFDYLEELEEDCGMEIELDIVALDCDYCEYESALSCLEECGYDCDLSGFDDDDKEAIALEYLHNNTQVIEFNSGIIIQEF
jgi:hypothetical protein